MPLSDIQFKEALVESSLKVLRSGKVPSLSKVTRQVQKQLPSEPGTPTVKARRQNRRAQWDLVGMNKTMGEVSFDFKVMYKALLESSDRVLRRLNLVETSTRAQHAQLDRIESEARNLLFLIQNGDSHFAGLYDDFHDLSKVNLEATTRDTVDLRSQVMELPDASPHTKKLSFDHLANANEWAYEIGADSQVISATTPRDAPFKNMFIDTVSMWRHDVVTSEAGPVSVTFTIPVHHISGGEISISRIQLIGVSEFTQRVEITHSNDGINYLVFDGASSVVELDKSSKAVNLDFPLTRVQYLRFTIYRSSYDKALDTGYLTSFGLKSLSVYSIGHAFSSQLISKVFPIADGKIVSKLAMSVVEEIPKGTDVKYYVAPLEKQENSDDPPLQDGVWVPITPVSRDRRSDEPTRVIRIGTLSDKTTTYIPKTPVTAQYRFKGQDFFALNSPTDTATPEKITDDIVYGTAFISRGKNAWLRKKTGDDTVFNVTGNFISFSSGPRQKLYTTAQETVGFSTPLNLNGIERSVIDVSRPIDYRYDAGMSVKPPDGVDPYSVPDPLHAVYEVVLTSNSDEYEETVVFPTSPFAKYKLTKSPIDVFESQEEIERLSAYRPNLGTHDENLIIALEARPGLSDYHGNIIKLIAALSTPEDVAAGKPQFMKFTVGTADGSAVPQERIVEGEVIETVSTPAPSKRPYSELSDEELLALFGRVKFRTKFISGIRAESVLDPTKIYLPGEHFEVTLIPDPTTGIKELYVSRAPDNPARAYSIAVGETVKFKFKYKKNLTQHVVAVQGNKIFLDRKFSDFTNANAGFRVKVGYRFVPVGTNEVLPNTLVVSSADKKKTYVHGKDYHFNAKDGTITIISSGSIPSVNGKTVVYASYSYKGALNSLDTFSIWAFVSSRDPIRIHYPKLEIDSEFGEKVLVSTGTGSLVDISGTTETPDLEYGWHQIMVLSRDPDIYGGTAIKKVAELLDLAGQPVFMSGGDYFSDLQGSRVPLSQVPIDFLRNSVLPNDHSKFAIDETGMVIVNFQPNTQKDFYTYGFRLVGSGALLDNTAAFYDEEFTLNYSYHRPEARTIRGVVVRIVMTRGRDTNDGVTPKVFGYQVRVG